MARNISGEIDLEKELAIGLEGSKSGVWTLPQVENTHNLYQHFRFTIAIVLKYLLNIMIIKKFHYRPALA